MYKSELQYVKIIFETSQFMMIQKDRAAKFADMLSALGGTIGLLTGFSLISGVEIIYFAAKFIMKCCKRITQNDVIIVK